ncbi:GIY-YIG nuclease family protein [Crocinitomix algicola]|uniref:GIY-YIG nuclease family protein n=1 Tax=Crocinitomix algicola TaxID=1740263 RepID=UPI00082ABBEE|nr:GIY-YIG nuclease family protein [Crocinitomix algicola]
METHFAVYVLYSDNFDKIYIGYTSNLIQRIYYHNNGHKGYTKNFRPWKVIHVEIFLSKTLAIKREKMLKGSKGRMWIKIFLAALTGCPL